MDLLEQLRSILGQDEDRTAKAKRIAQVIRASGPYRWVGIYDVDLERETVLNIAWDGPNAPAYPEFSTSKGLTSRAITQRRTVNVGNVAEDANYLTALDSTRSEIIVPIMDGADGTVVGTVDVESERLDAFDGATQSLLEECARVLETFWNSPLDCSGPSHWRTPQWRETLPLETGRRGPTTVARTWVRSCSANFLN